MAKMRAPGGAGISGRINAQVKLSFELHMDIRNTPARRALLLNSSSLTASYWKGQDAVPTTLAPTPPAPPMTNCINPDSYGADPTGVNASDAAINAALAAGKLICMTPGGTYRLAGTIHMHPNQRLTGNGCTFTQGTGANLLVFFDFGTNVANNSQLDDCVIDGNSANNTNTGTVLVNVVTASKVKILSNTIRNSTGGGVALSTSFGSTVQDNDISACPNFGVAVIGSTSGYTASAKVKDNRITGPYFHGIQATQASVLDISGNTLDAGGAIGDIVAPLHVSVSGTAVTWVSGPTFAGAVAGTIMVANGGAEGIIQSVNSTTSITLINSLGTLTNVLAAIGSGDVISITNDSYARVNNNEVTGGVTGGIVIANTGGSFPSTDSSLGHSVIGNTISSSGQFGIACEAFTATGSPVLNDLAISSNIIINPGRIGAAGALPLGIQLASATGLMTNISVTGNTLHDYASVAGGYWLGNSGTAGATNVVLAGNTNVGFAMGTAPNGY